MELAKKYWSYISSDTKLQYWSERCNKKRMNNLNQKHLLGEHTNLHIAEGMYTVQEGCIFPLSCTQKIKIRFLEIISIGSNIGREERKGLQLYDKVGWRYLPLSHRYCSLPRNKCLTEIASFLLWKRSHHF